MQLTKHREYFDPSRLEGRVHLIGCGATGSTVAELLTRLGLTKITLWDFDKVEPHNLANQNFFEHQLGHQKTAAVFNNMALINPDIMEDTVVKDIPYVDQPLSGWIFLCMDNIDTRRQIVTKHMNNTNIRGMFDFRLGLMDGQHYAARWDNQKEKDNLLAQMQFTHEEAKANTPMSACGTSLCVVPGVRLIIAAGVANFMNMAMDKPYKRIILSDAEQMTLDSF